ncbi:MAG: redoxin domain-containing protein [Anaerolineae bacterium]|nr:redoxin domain-containing protein [Anaerolineae bacterium]
MQEVTIGLALIAGFLSFISPCVLPLIPAYIGYMGGRMTRSVAVQTAGSKTTQQSALASRMGLMIHSLAFVLGFTTVFVILGLVTTGIISSLGSVRFLITDIIGRAGGLLIIVFGLHFMGVLPSIFRWLRKHDDILNSVLLTIAIAVVMSIIIPWAFVEILIAIPIIAAFLIWLFLGGAFTEPGKFWGQLIDGFERIFYTDTRKQMNANDASGLGGSFVMGIVFAAGWTPCIGPIYGAILNTASLTGEVATAVVSLAAYSLGLGIPFMLTALLLERAQGILRRLQKHMRIIEVVSGSFLIFIGVLVASGQLQSLSTTLSTGSFSDFTFRVEECTIGFAEGKLQFEHLGSCYGGELEAIAVNQGLFGEMSADVNQRQYILHIDAEDISEPLALDVEMARLENITPAAVLYGPSGDVLAEGDVLIQTEDDRYRILSGVPVQQSGLYRLVISNTLPLTEEDDAKYQIRFVESLDSSEPSETEQSSDSPLTDIASEGVNSIEALAEQSDALEGLEIGNTAPNFTITTIGGETVALEDLRGHTVLLNFWGTWCGPCRREMPEFQALYEEYADQGFTILALAVNDKEEDVLAFQEEFELTFPLALDNDDVVNKLYEISSQPSTILIDADGIIQFQSFGIVTLSQIEPVIESTLNS